LGLRVEGFDGLDGGEGAVEDGGGGGQKSAFGGEEGVAEGLGEGLDEGEDGEGGEDDESEGPGAGKGEDEGCECGCEVLDEEARCEGRRLAHMFGFTAVELETKRETHTQRNIPCKRGHEACWGRGRVVGVEPGHLLGRDGGIDVASDGEDVGIACADPEGRRDAAEDKRADGESEELECGRADAVEETRHVLGRRVGKREAGKGVERVADDGGHVRRDSASDDGCGDGREGEEQKSASWKKGKEGERGRVGGCGRSATDDSSPLLLLECRECLSTEDAELATGVWTNKNESSRRYAPLSDSTGPGSEFLLVMMWT
jgi:hypothetical protein